MSSQATEQCVCDIADDANVHNEPCANYRGDDQGFCLNCDHAEECHEDR